MGNNLGNKGFQKDAIEIEYLFFKEMEE